MLGPASELTFGGVLTFFGAALGAALVGVFAVFFEGRPAGEAPSEGPFLVPFVEDFLLGAVPDESWLSAKALPAFLFAGGYF